MAGTAAGLALKLNAAARGVKAANPRGVRAAQMRIRTAVAGLAPNHLRGVGKTGARLGVVAGPVSELAGGAEGLVKVTGPFQLIERDTKAHEIDGNSRGITQFRHDPEDIRMVVIEHPGTTGKHPFARGVETAQVGLVDVVNAPMAEAIVAAFR